jgi:hypothetical protein
MYRETSRPYFPIRYRNHRSKLRYAMVHKPTDKYNDLHKLVDEFKRWNENKRDSGKRKADMAFATLKGKSTMKKIRKKRQPTSLSLAQKPKEKRNVFVAEIIYMKTASTFMNPYDRKGGFPTKPYWIKSPKSLRKTLISSTTLKIAKSA